MENPVKMRHLILLFSVVFSIFPKEGTAQSNSDLVWVQIAARPTYAAALEEVEGFARILPDVNGLALRSGWYAAALGPYTPDDAAEVMRSYLLRGVIPNDSFIAETALYAQQFWPPGQDLLGRGSLSPPGALTGGADPAPAPVAVPPVAAPDETVQQARRSESLLTAQERRDLQTALQAAGFYNAAIDGAFGRGTRTSMAAWQEARGFEATGVLTTGQRAALLDEYNAVLDGLDMALVRDTAAGIDIKLPTALVGFQRYDPPFAQYDPLAAGPARVLLISQTGDRGTLQSLYDIMQTLAIVPIEGPRQLSRDSFTIMGRNADIISETEVFLQDGEIKGFTLIWPTGDEARRLRVLQEMRASFQRRPGTIDPSLGSEAAVDLFAGLEVRSPKLSRSGFYVHPTGAVVTTANAVENCTNITLDETTDAILTGIDLDLGLALLTPRAALAPPDFARFSPAAPGLRSEVAVAGYSFEGQLDAPSVTFGTLADLRGLRGEAEIGRLALDALPGDAGGPVLDSRGHVFGMLLPRPDGGRQLPPDVHFALKGDAIAGLLERARLNPARGDGQTPLDPVEITDRAVGITVLVSCWE